MPVCTYIVQSRNRVQGSKVFELERFMDWVHCNKCFVHPSPNSGRSFLLSECGHIYCSQCQQREAPKGVNGLCLVCGAQKSAIRLTSQLGPNVVPYFTHPAELVKSISAAVQFQLQMHSRRQSEHRRKLATIARIWQLRASLERLQAARERARGQLGLTGQRAATWGLSQTPLPAREANVRTPG